MPFLPTALLVTAAAAHALGTAPLRGFQPPAKPGIASVAAPAAAVVPDSTARAVEAFARLQRAINQLRDKEQAELAEPRNKKVEEQATIREKYRKWRADSLAAHGFSAVQVRTMTQRLSSDDALRALFEATMERLSK